MEAVTARGRALVIRRVGQADFGLTLSPRGHVRGDLRRASIRFSREGRRYLVKPTRNAKTEPEQPSGVLWGYTSCRKLASVAAQNLIIAPQANGQTAPSALASLYPVPHVGAPGCQRTAEGCPSDVPAKPCDSKRRSLAYNPPAARGPKMRSRRLEQDLPRWSTCIGVARFLGRAKYVTRSRWAGRPLSYHLAESAKDLITACASCGSVETRCANEQDLWLPAGAIQR